MIGKWAWFLVITAVLICVPHAVAAACQVNAFGLQIPIPTVNIFDGVLSTAQATGSNWSANLLGPAEDLFWLLAALELTWTAGMLILQRDNLGEFVAQFFLRFLSIMVFFGLLLAPTWSGKTSFQLLSDTVVHGFSATAEQATSNSAYPIKDVSPDCMLAQGVGYGGAMLRYAVMTSSIVSSSTTSPTAVPGVLKTISNANLGNPEVLLVVLAAVCTLLAFVVMAGQLVLVQIEAYLVLGLGMLMTGFAGSRWTLSMAEKYWTYAIGVGIKMMVIFGVLAFAQTVMDNSFTMMILQALTVMIAHAAVANGVAAMPVPGTELKHIVTQVLTLAPIYWVLEIAVGSAVLAMVCLQSSSIAGGLITGTSSMSFANGMGQIAGAIGGLSQMAFGAAQHKNDVATKTERDDTHRDDLARLNVGGMGGTAASGLGTQGGGPSGNRSFGTPQKEATNNLNSALNSSHPTLSGQRFQSGPASGSTFPSTPQFGLDKLPSELHSTADKEILEKYANPQNLNYLTKDQQLSLATNSNLEKVLGKGPTNELRDNVRKNLEKSHAEESLSDPTNEAYSRMQELQGLRAMLPGDNQNVGAVQIRFKHSGRDE